MQVSRLIIENVRENEIRLYLKSQGIEQKKDKEKQKFEEWLSDIIDNGKIDIDSIDDCIWDELMYGNRRLIRVYKLKTTRKIKCESDWSKFLKAFNCPGLNFNNIIQTTTSDEGENNGGEKLKVCGIKTNFEDGKIKYLDILFLYSIKIKDKSTNSLEKFYSYIPVTLDLNKKLMIIKVWNKEQADTGDTPYEQLDYVVNRIMDKFDFEISTIIKGSQEVLYKMSKGLFNEFFFNLPNSETLEEKKCKLAEVTNLLLDGIQLENSEIVGGLKTMNKEVINVDDELYKLIQQIALYDHLKNNDMDSLLKNTDRYISRIRFSDIDNLTASLNSEDGKKCIFDAKTFMSVRNSLDLVKRIVTVVVSYPKYSGKGLLPVKYNAADNRYIYLHILKDRYYNNEDFEMIWRLYEDYESGNITNGKVCTEDDAEAI